MESLNFLFKVKILLNFSLISLSTLYNTVKVKQFLKLQVITKNLKQINVQNKTNCEELKLESEFFYYEMLNFLIEKVKNIG